MICQLCEQDFVTEWQMPGFKQMYHLQGYKLEGYNNTVFGTLCGTCLDELDGKKLARMKKLRSLLRNPGEENKERDARVAAIVKARLKGLIR